MADNERNALVVQGPRSLAQVGAGARNILSSVVSDALTIASSREKALTSTLFRIGSYEFREPDYRQILIWARAFEFEPIVFVSTLEKICFTYWGLPTVVFAVEKGAIVSLAWDVVALPIKNFDWVAGLTIRDFAVFGQEEEHRDISFDLPSLRSLIIKSVNLAKLDLSNVPNLTKLFCGNNQLTELDLSNMPNLTGLCCEQNQLAELDLSNVPNLTELWCGTNQLTELDLSNVPNLTKLGCSENQLTEIDLSNVPNLTAELHCDPSVRVVKFPSQNFKRYPPERNPPMRYWFNEARNELFPMEIPPPDAGDCIEVAEADYNEYVALARAEAAKGIANDDE